MSISEVFPNPTVKEVIFQVRFPNLFFLERKIGDFQIKVMKEFPKSALIQRRQVLYADIGPEGDMQHIPAQFKEDMTARKIWQFISEKNFKLNVSSDSLDITSSYHKTYNLDKEGVEKFRDVIQFVVDRFLEVIEVPIFTRIGLRYIDECPIPLKDNDAFISYYNTAFPLHRFNLVDTHEMLFKAMVKRGSYYCGYIEKLQEAGNKHKLILDFDGYTENIASHDYLKVTDDLHKIISEEYVNTIKDPVYKYMRQEKSE